MAGKRRRCLALLLGFALVMSNMGYYPVFAAQDETAAVANEADTR